MTVAERRMELLRSEGRSLGHDHGYSKESPDLDIDQEKLRRGISFLHRNFFSVFVSMLTGLLTLMYVETIAAVLFATKKSNSTILSFSRYLSTINHTISWYQDVPQLLQSSAKVRYLHKQASQLQNFSQYEMVVTQWAFVGPLVLWPHKLGVASDDRGVDGLVYVMFLVGRELGICEEFNMCNGDMDTVRKHSREILDQEIKPVFLSTTVSQTCQDLSAHLLAGIHILNPFIVPASFLTWANLTVHELDCVDTSHLDSFSVIMFKLQRSVLSSMFHLPLLGSVLRLLANNLMYLNIYLATDWQHFIVRHHQQQQETSKKEVDKRLGMLMGLFTIPVLMLISFSTAAFRQLLRHRSEMVLFVSVSILSVILLNFYKI